MQLSFGKMVRAKIVPLGFILLVTKLSNPTASPGRCDFNIIHSSIWASWCLPRPNWRWHWWFLVVHPNWQKWFGNVKFSEWQLQTSQKCCTCQLFMMNVERMKKKSGSWFIWFISGDEHTLKKWDYGSASKACPTSRFCMKFLLASGLPSFRALIGIVDESQDATNQRAALTHPKGFFQDWLGINTQVVWSELAKIFVSGLGWTHESQLQLNTLGDVVAQKQAQSRMQIDPIHR